MSFFYFKGDLDEQRYLTEVVCLHLLERHRTFVSGILGSTYDDLEGARVYRGGYFGGKIM